MSALASSTAASSMMAPTDTELIARIRAGDVVAFELVMRRYNRRLFRIARSILKDPSEAEDALQESYMRAYANIGSFQGPDGFSAWLCRIVSNEALGRLRQRARVVSLETYRSSFDGEERSREVEMFKATQPGPERLAASSEIRRALEQAIDALPAIEGMSITETAESLGIRPETVKTRFHRARRILRDRLAGQFEQAMPGAFEFAGERCDRIVAAVLARIQADSVR
jgi:RNA polymerase sigma-70 factor (ECF subfamily)